MKVVDLHPDDLLDKDARSELTDAERTRLDAHLERCATCRFEREVRADFADELDEEEELSSQRLLSIMEGADAPKPLVDEETEGAPPPARISTRPTRTRRTMRALLLVAAALLVGSAATAGAGRRVWTSVASVLHLETTHPESPPAPPAPAPVVVKAATATPVAIDTVVPPPEDPPIAPAPSVSAPVETAATLFDAANRARSSGDYGRAIALHRRLESTYPTSREAHVSYATLGRMLLDRGDAAGALAAFQTYQGRGPGPMDEAVLVGTATSLERLGRDGEARATWARLVTSFPDTPYREHAKARLEGR